MNCPSRTDALIEDGMNQSPNAYAPDITTRSDFGQIANARTQRDHRVGVGGDATDTETVALQQLTKGPDKNGTSVFAAAGEGGGDGGGLGKASDGAMSSERNNFSDSMAPPHSQSSRIPPIKHLFHRARSVLVKYGKFMGPGFMISVAYIDPGNYATAVAAGATYRFRLLFMVLASNIIAIFLQSLCTKLGTVTGMNLAENCKANFPPWLNYTLYFFAESAIIATDIAEVIGTAIALNLLLHIPLVAGCAISIVDVIVILFFYRPGRSSMRGLRLFEFFVALLVIGVVVCFCFQLSLVRDTGVGEVFKGYLPSKALVQGQGLYQACGILGATVMPHSLYLGSGLIQARLREFDKLNTPDSVVGQPHPHPHSDSDEDGESEEEVKYRPSIAAIRSCLSYSIAEQSISLFTFALFVNSAILIVAGASLYGVSGAEEADLFGIHDLLSRTMAPVAGTIYALALLLSGISAGIVCTIAGQMVSEGQLSLKMKPWIRRLFTRSISVTPSIIIAGAVGKEGLNAALNGSQVALSVILPFVTAPLIYLTCRNKFMTVATREGEGGPGGIKMANNRLTATIAVALWLLICVMNVSLLVLVGLGEVD